MSIPTIATPLPTQGSREFSDEVTGSHRSRQIKQPKQPIARLINKIATSVAESTQNLEGRPTQTVQPAYSQSNLDENKTRAMYQQLNKEEKIAIHSAAIRSVLEQVVKDNSLNDNIRGAAHEALTGIDRLQQVDVYGYNSLNTLFLSKHKNSQPGLLIQLNSSNKPPYIVINNNQDLRNPEIREALKADFSNYNKSDGKTYFGVNTALDGFGKPNSEWNPETHFRYYKAPLANINEIAEQLVQEKESAIVGNPSESLSKNFINLIPRAVDFMQNGSTLDLPTAVGIPYQLRVEFGKNVSLQSFTQPFTNLAKDVSLIVSAINGDDLQQVQHRQEQAAKVGSWVDVVVSGVISFTGAGAVLTATQAVAGMIDAAVNGHKIDPLDVVTLTLSFLPGGKLGAAISKASKTGGKLVKGGIVATETTLDIVTTARDLKASIKTGNYQQLLGTLIGGTHSARGFKSNALNQTNLDSLNLAKGNFKVEKNGQTSVDVSLSPSRLPDDAFVKTPENVQKTSLIGSYKEVEFFKRDQDNSLWYRQSGVENNSSTWTKASTETAGDNTYHLIQLGGQRWLKTENTDSSPIYLRQFSLNGKKANYVGFTNVDGLRWTRKTNDSNAKWRPMSRLERTAYSLQNAGGLSPLPKDNGGRSNDTAESSQAASSEKAGQSSKTTQADTSSRPKKPAANYPTTQYEKVYRGDSRAPREVFGEGFTPQGTNTDLRNHLNFAGNSAYVATTSSKNQAATYAFGRSSEGNTIGYLYKIGNSPQGIDVASLYKKDPAAQRNQEVAIQDSIPGEDIKGAYEVIGTRHNPKIGKYIPNKNFKKIDSAVIKVLSEGNGAELVKLIGNSASREIVNKLKASHPKISPEQIDIYLSIEVANLNKSHKHIAGLREKSLTGGVFDQPLIKDGKPTTYSNNADGAVNWILDASNSRGNDGNEFSVLLQEYVNNGKDLTDFSVIKELHQKLVPNINKDFRGPVPESPLPSSIGGEVMFKRHLEGLKSNSVPSSTLGKQLFAGVVGYHAFIDGNGRLGRFLYAVTELRNGDFKAMSIDAEKALTGLK
ncbi:hypothetical protein H0A36_19015 [Endozoicomonas sp. SM1973]|uniref:Fido domain-containing protein n=1 Tax=Spartinivicinus marinus TaxID=2994442 RepID=A0A853IDV3_9GAMM|nr:hypothetical protein [Spartinivicinus marinus]MCX4025926.1 hypothetical protein [Spartinivicinus marinus]NYZ68111.1 hypothetical protein [Spartinivicinus marinus]